MIELFIYMSKFKPCDWFGATKRSCIVYLKNHVTVTFPVTTRKYCGVQILMSHRINICLSDQHKHKLHSVF